MIDGFSTGTIKDITGTLTAVGFSSPPHWIKPYHVLSNGERFRCDLARAILEGGDLVVFDEFTSVVDRTVARIGSAAVAKAVRRMGRRFVAISCHYDIAPWLEPDWVLDMQTGTLHQEAASATRHPRGHLSIRRCGVGRVCEVSLSERRAEPHGALLLGLHRPAAGGVLRGAAVDRFPGAAADLPDRGAPRFPGRRRGPRRCSTPWPPCIPG